MEKATPILIAVFAVIIVAAAGVILPQQMEPPATSEQAGEQGGEHESPTQPLVSSTNNMMGEQHADETGHETPTQPGAQATSLPPMPMQQSGTGAPMQAAEEDHGGGMMPRGMMGGAEGMMREGDGHGREEAFMAACSAISQYTPQENIMWLLQNHDRFNWTYLEFPDNMSIRWTIVADSPEAAKRLYEHILQMECILENGGTPREMDPVFKLESLLYEYIHTNVTLKEGNVVEVVKSGDNACAFEVVRLHAQVVQGFFERGMEEARQLHPVPPEVLSQCEELVGEIDLTGGEHGGMGPGMGGHGHRG